MMQVQVIYNAGLHLPTSAAPCKQDAGPTGKSVARPASCSVLEVSRMRKGVGIGTVEPRPGSKCSYMPHHGSFNQPLIRRLHT